MTLRKKRFRSRSSISKYYPLPGNGFICKGCIFYDESKYPRCRMYQGCLIWYSHGKEVCKFYEITK